MPLFIFAKQNHLYVVTDGLHFVILFCDFTIC